MGDKKNHKDGYIIVEAKDHSVAKDKYGGCETGIHLEPGDIIMLNANRFDKWSSNDGKKKDTSNADGQGHPYGYGKFDTLKFEGQRFLRGSLVGSIGKDDGYFAVGTHLTMTVLSKGELRLYFWDKHWKDNECKVRVDYKLYRGPKKDD